LDDNTEGRGGEEKKKEADPYLGRLLEESGGGEGKGGQ